MSFLEIYFLGGIIATLIIAWSANDLFNDTDDDDEEFNKLKSIVPHDKLTMILAGVNLAMILLWPATIILLIYFYVKDYFND